MVNFYIAAFLADLAIGAVLLAIPLFLIYRFAASSLLLGILGAVGALVYSAGVIIVGRMADRFSRRKIILFGCGMFAVAYSVLPFLKTTNQILLAYAFGSASMAMFWPTLQSWLSQGLDKPSLMRSLTIFNISWSAGLMVGFFSAGFLFALGQEVPFAFGVILIVITMLFLYRQPPAPRVKAVTKLFSDGVNKNAAGSPMAGIGEDKPANYISFLYIAWCANFVSWFNLGVMRNLFPKLGTELGFSTALVGTLIFIITFAQTVMFFVLGRTHRWHYKLGLILLFQFIAFLSLWIFVFSSCAVHFAIAMIFLGLSAGLTYFSSIFYSLYGSVDKGRKSGLHEAVIGTGAFFGPFAGGLFAAKFGIRAPYLVAAVVVAAAMLLEIALIGGMHKKTLKP